MIESQTELPVQGSGPATIWAKGRHVVAVAIAQVREKVRALPGSRGARSPRGLGLLVSGLIRQSQFRTDFTQIVRRVAAGTGDVSLLNRFALHLVVVFLAVGVVAVSQFDLPQIDVLLPTPTPAPDLGEHTVTAPPTTRGFNRFTINNNTALFGAPVLHTTRAERDRMEIITYTVQPNDNVWAIAQGFGLQVETVMWANPAVEKAPDLLSVGQILAILPVDGIYYTVQLGDTVEKIAKRFKVTADKITAFELNGLQDPYTLTPGQQLVVPGGQKPLPPAQNLYPYTRVGKPPKDAPTGSGRFAWPTQGLLSQQFWSGHPAIDIANRAGTPIYAADDGYVLSAGRDTWGYGNQIVIDHGNGYLTRYAHLQTILVKAGQVVKKNQKIGTMGSTGRSTGPHLHFEVIYNQVLRNPTGFLR